MSERKYLVMNGEKRENFHGEVEGKGELQKKSKLGNRMGRRAEHVMLNFLLRAVKENTRLLLNSSRHTVKLSVLLFG